jgi:hypothetical protein
MAYGSISLMVIGFISLRYLDLQMIGYLALLGSLLFAVAAATRSHLKRLLRRLVFCGIVAPIVWWGDEKVFAVYILLFGFLPVTVHWIRKGKIMW